GGRVDRRNAANRVQRRMHADSPMEESGDSDDDAEELSNAIQAAMNSAAAAASSPFWKSVEPFFHFPAPEDIARLRQMSGATEGADDKAHPSGDRKTDPGTSNPAAAAAAAAAVNSNCNRNGNGNGLGLLMGSSESRPPGSLLNLPCLMSVTPAGNRSPAGGLGGVAGGGLGFGALGGDDFTNPGAGLGGERQDDEISSHLRTSQRRLQVKSQHNQHKAAYLEEVVASRRLEEERSCEKLVVDRLLEMAYARRTGLKITGATGTITKGAGSSLKLARQSAVHFVRRALQRAEEWQAGTLLPHLQRVHPDLQPSPSLLAEPSPLPWTPGPGGVGTPGMGGVGGVSTPGGIPGTPAAAAAAAGTGGGAPAGGADGSGAGASGAGATSSLLALFNRQRLALFPPSPPRNPIPLSFTTPTTNASTAAATAAAGGAAAAATPGGASPAHEIAGLSPLGAGGGAPDAETDSLVASMLIPGSPCDFLSEPHSRGALRRIESRGERMGGMAGGGVGGGAAAGMDGLDGSFRHKERTARLEDVFGAGGAGAGGSPGDAAAAAAAAGGGNRFGGGASPAAAAAGGAGGTLKGGPSAAGAGGGGSGGPVLLPPGNVKRKRTDRDRDNVDFTKGGSPARRTGDGGLTGPTPTGEFDTKLPGSSQGDFFSPGSSHTHSIPLGKRSRASGVGPGKSGKRKASADDFPDLDPNRNAMPTTPQPELEQVVELESLAAGSVFGSAMPELGVQGDDFGWLAGLPSDELLLGGELGGLDDGLAVPTDNLADLGF
ncbi:hypothetical protein CLOM_g8695, partial [Closterium sp. NIES-68]